MDKTAQTQRFRRFLVEALPEPLTSISRHLQIFDSYIENTRLRIRRVRDPHTSEWSRSLQQRFRIGPNTAKAAEIHLNDAEYALLEPLAGPEVRKNRYFHEFDGRMFAFDVYLGSLSGLITGKVESHPDDEGLELPPFALIDITNEEHFDGERLANTDIQAIRRIMQSFLDNRGQP